MSSLLSRIGAWFVEPPPAPADAPQPVTRFIPPTAARAGAAREGSARAAGADEPDASAAPALHAIGGAAVPGAPAADALGTAAVLGAPAVAMPVAAACAGELRARARAAAALLCIWRPAGPAASAEAAAPPAGATTPGARRLAARLTAHELAATAWGRLAWLALEPDPPAAADQFRRCLAVAGAPTVLAVAGARPPAFEPLLAELDLAVAVLPPGIEPALRDLALATLRARNCAVLPPLPPGPPRWAAMAGLARLRSLPGGDS